MRLLFCVPTTALSGGVKVIFELAHRMAEQGHTVHVFSFAAAPRWWTLHVPLLPVRDLEPADLPSYDFVIVANAFLLPLVLPLLGSARAIFFCQDYEAFHHAAGTAYADFMAESPTFAKLYRLPVPIVVTSRAVQGLIRRRLGVESIHVPIAIDKTIFRPQPPRREATGPARVLMVGNYLMPYKGIRDGLEALRRLAAEMPVQLVLVTQERQGRRLFDDLPFPVEIHYCPTDAQMPAILAGCDVYCCASWYEGFGLPALEAFACGVPVVSTRTHGVSDYGVDGTNLLLANPNDPADLHAALRAVLSDQALRERLRHGGFETIGRAYDWDASVARLSEAIARIDGEYRGAGAIDADAMAALLDELEREGCFTPVRVYREYERLAQELDAVLRTLTDAHSDRAGAVTRLAALRDGFARHLVTPRAQYHEAFKAKYDVCRLVLALADSEQATDTIRRLQHPGHGREDRTGRAFSEIRYRE